MKVVVIVGQAKSLLNFRGPLLAMMVKEGHEVLACADGDNVEVASSLKKMGVAYHSIPVERAGLNPIKDLCTFLELYSFFKKSRPDIALNYTIKPVIYGSLAAYIAGVSNVFSMITGLGYVFTGETLKHRVIRRVVKNMYQSALMMNKTVFFLNPDDLILFANLGLAAPHKQILINGTGVDLTYFGKALVTDQPIFLLIARLLKDKGIIEYVAAARILTKRYPNAVFRLLGPFDSNPTAIGESQVEGWKKEGAIEYMGDTEDVRPYLSSSNICVLPSYREGTPRAVLEAMAMGRPIITTDAPGCRETVIEGENGFLVPVKNVNALVEAMEKFIVHPELIERMGRRSREIAEEKYDVHKVNDVILGAMGLLKEIDQKTV